MTYQRLCSPINLVAGFMATMLVALPDNAMSQTKYPSWSNPNAPATAAGGSQVQQFADELNKLINDAERDRAASPQFLRDLRDLARRHDNPWRVSLLKDDFSDGNFTQNPVWSVTKGQFRIERGFGLRGSFDQTSTSTTSSGSSNSGSSSSGGDAAAQLLGAILNQALGGGKKSSGSTQSSTASSSAVPQAAIHSAARITNAFSLRMELTSWKTEGFLEIGPYQGSGRTSGYRLIYRAGKTPSLELVRFSSRGTGLIDNYNQALAFEDKRTHVIEWTRDQFGEMKIGVDGKEVIKTNDQSFRDAFDGFSLTNNGGDFIVSKLTIEGTN